MTENPYDPKWVQIDTDQEDSLYEGMAVRIEDGEPERVIAIRSYDVDVDGDGYGNVYSTAVKVEEDGEWWHLHEVEFLSHELEWGKARYEAKLLMSRATVRVRYHDGEPRYSGRMASHLFHKFDHVIVRQYDAQGRQIFGLDQPHFPF